MFHIFIIAKNTDMMNALEESFATKTDEELVIYLSDVENHSAMEISVAVAELRKRGKFDESKFENILDVIRNKLGLGRPTSYSKEAIGYFSFFSILLGAILFSSSLKNRNDKWAVIGFGITYTVFTITIRSVFELHELGPLFLNFVGALLMEGYIFDLYIDERVGYKERSALTPAIIGAAILVILISLSIYFDQIETLLDVFGVSPDVNFSGY